MNEHDPVHHPAHYTSHPSGLECIVFAEWLGFNIGDAWKYVWRQAYKGASIQDLNKSLWYLDRAIAYPATIPHRRPTELPDSVRAAFTKLDEFLGTGLLDHALRFMWSAQFAAEPVHPITRARQCVQAVLEQMGVTP